MLSWYASNEPAENLIGHQNRKYACLGPTSLSYCKYYLEKTKHTMLAETGFINLVKDYKAMLAKPKNNKHTATATAAMNAILSSNHHNGCKTSVIRLSFGMLPSVYLLQQDLPKYALKVQLKMPKRIDFSFETACLPKHPHLALASIKHLGLKGATRELFELFVTEYKKLQGGNDAKRQADLKAIIQAFAKPDTPNGSILPNDYLPATELLTQGMPELALHYWAHQQVKEIAMLRRCLQHAPGHLATVMKLWHEPIPQDFFEELLAKARINPYAGYHAALVAGIRPTPTGYSEIVSQQPSPNLRYPAVYLLQQGPKLQSLAMQINKMATCPKAHSAFLEACIHVSLPAKQLLSVFKQHPNHIIAADVLGELCKALVFTGDKDYIPCIDYLIDEKQGQMRIEQAKIQFELPDIPKANLSPTQLLYRIGLLDMVTFLASSHAQFDGELMHTLLQADDSKMIHEILAERLKKYDGKQIYYNLVAFDCLVPAYQLALLNNDLKLQALLIDKLKMPTNLIEQAENTIHAVAEQKQAALKPAVPSLQQPAKPAAASANTTTSPKIVCLSPQDIKIIAADTIAPASMVTVTPVLGALPNCKPNQAQTFDRATIPVIFSAKATEPPHQASKQANHAVRPTKPVAPPMPTAPSLTQLVPCP